MWRCQFKKLPTLEWWRLLGCNLDTVKFRVDALLAAISVTKKSVADTMKVDYTVFTHDLGIPHRWPRLAVAIAKVINISPRWIIYGTDGVSGVLNTPAKRFKFARLINGVSLAESSDLFGVGVDVLRDFEREQGDLAAIDMEGVCKFLGFDVDWVLAGANEEEQTHVFHLLGVRDGFKNKVEAYCPGFLIKRKAQEKTRAAKNKRRLQRLPQIRFPATPVEGNVGVASPSDDFVFDCSEDDDFGSMFSENSQNSDVEIVFPHSEEADKWLLVYGELCVSGDKNILRRINSASSYVKIALNKYLKPNKIIVGHCESLASYYREVGGDKGFDVGEMLRTGLLTLELFRQYKGAPVEVVESVHRLLGIH